jgi:hypothetical protein
VAIVEVKPKVQTQPPKPRKRQTKKALQEVMTWEVNKAKWSAAKRYAEKQGIDFMILTEDHLGIS